MIREVASSSPSLKSQVWSLLSKEVVIVFGIWWHTNLMIEVNNVEDACEVIASGEILERPSW